MKEQIDIEVLSSLEAVRRRPRFYVGDLDAPDLYTRLFKQALCHAVDEGLSGRCTELTATIHGRSAVVHYDAPMPLIPRAVDDGQLGAMLLLSRLSACHNQKTHIHVGHELCEIGIAVLNALCSQFIAEVSQNGQAATYRFMAGDLLAGPDLQPTSEPSYTQLSFTLDGSIVPDRCFDINNIKGILQDVSNAVPGLSCHLSQ